MDKNSLSPDDIKLIKTQLSRCKHRWLIEDLLRNNGCKVTYPIPIDTALKAIQVKHPRYCKVELMSMIHAINMNLRKIDLLMHRDDREQIIWFEKHVQHKQLELELEFN